MEMKNEDGWGRCEMEVLDGMEMAMAGGDKGWWTEMKDGGQK